MYKLICLFTVFLLSQSLFSQDWLHLKPPRDKANGKTIVFVTGDDEYKSETSMPMMAQILSEKHGFECKVLFAINRKRKTIDTSQRDNIPGLEGLKDADLMVIYTRFRELEDRQMKMIEDYLNTGRPIIGIRTATHAFNFQKAPESAFKKYCYSNTDENFFGGFGGQIFGQTWVRHWGWHGKQSSRGRFAKGQEKHPIFKGIEDGEIWGPTDVYETTLPQPEGCIPILLGEVCEDMTPESGPVPKPPEGSTGRKAIDKNDPMMPIAWTYSRDTGEKGRVFVSTIGGAMAGQDDWANEGMRRMFVNACFWTLKMEAHIPEKADVSPIFDPNPFRRGITPQQAMEEGTYFNDPKNRTVLFYGNSMVERLLEHGEMEARLQIARPYRKWMVRSLAWTGDEVGNRFRLEGYAKHMKNLLGKWPAQTIVLGYGLFESYAGPEGLEAFKQQYKSHLTQLSQVHPGAHFVFLSPNYTEDKINPHTKLYSQAIKDIAKEHQGTFINLHKITQESKQPTTSNGIHLNDYGNSLIAKEISKQLLKAMDKFNPHASEPKPDHLKEVMKGVAAKQYRIAEVVRPKNAVVYFGVRARPYEYEGEMPRYHKMIDKTEKVVYQLARYHKATYEGVTKPKLSPMPEGRGRDDGDRTGIIKPVSEAIEEFKVADGYEVNLFASEEQFPELRNPVQIAFDARGRLWVVTMPSFPHTVPGMTPQDKIIILEDTNKDGKADKLSVFAEGLDALDGVAFHRDGVIISEQPKLWIMKDTDGDDRADIQVELLRGIDVTDSHHGGMIATDPTGDIIFCDGVFHRSQLETPYGVHRGIDATTYRLNPNNGAINTEWQHTTPNPWNVTFDKWGNFYQMFGDGDVYDGTSLVWTPLGSYHPYAYARITSYGKGCGTSIISSPNFPDKYQQGLASASLLGRYAVNLTVLKHDEGMKKQVSYETILSSPNAAFRPADLEFGMDGALYVSDFCSPIIGHAQHPMRDPHWDHDYGRVWRIVHTGKPTVKDYPKIEGANSKELCQLLTHSQDLIRHHARIELRKQGPAGAKAVQEWIALLPTSSKDYEQAALEALYVLEGFDIVNKELLTKLLKSKSDVYRSAAVKMIRLQADRLDNVSDLLSTTLKDLHPRVQMDTINAIAHIQSNNPNIKDLLKGFTSDNKNVKTSLSYLDWGTKPHKGRSVPVLNISPKSQLNFWQYLGKKGKDPSEDYQVGKEKLPGVGVFRSFFKAESQQPAIIAIKHKSLEVRLNNSLVFHQDSFWSGDQQINVTLKEGLNNLEVVLLDKGRRSSKSMPPVYVYDPVGEVVQGVHYLKDMNQLKEAVTLFEKQKAEQGETIYLQTAAELKFSPKKLEVNANTKVRLFIENPDIMIHNWVLLKPGSVEEVGKLADQLAASPEGVKKGYLPDSKNIIIASKLLNPTDKQEITFTTPKESGEYPYICTFPGHWRLMQGVLIVK